MPTINVPAPPKQRDGSLFREEEAVDADFSSVFGAPPVLRGESTADYQALYSELAGAIAPRDKIEELLVREATDFAWEALRWRRYKAKLLDAAEHQGLQKILAVELAPDWLVPKVLGAPTPDEVLANQFARREPAALEKVNEILVRIGLDREAIAALTLSIRLQDIAGIEQLSAQAGARRNATFREIDRHREAVARHRRSSDATDIPFEDDSRSRVQQIRR